MTRNLFIIKKGLLKRFREPGTRNAKRRAILSMSALWAAAACAALIPALPGMVSGGTGTDTRGEKVTIPDREVRVVSLSPGATETLYEIGVKDEIVGVSDYCNYPPEFVTKKPRMGGFSTPNIEKIQAARPQVVVLTTVVPLNVKAQFDRLGIALFVAEPRSFSQLLDLIEQFGLLLNKKNEAYALVRGMSDEAGKVTCRIRARSIAPVRTFIEIWYNPYYAAERTTLPGDIVAMAGGRVIPDSGNQYSRIDEETLLKLDPEAVILGHKTDLNTFLDTHRNVASVYAIRNKKIFSPNPDEFLRPGPRVVKALGEIAQFLHPEAF